MKHIPLIGILIAISAACLLSGCHSSSAAHADGLTGRRNVLSQAMLPLNLSAVQPDEAGLIPILEYHNIVSARHTTGYQYSAADFRSDMNWLYAHNYRPISLSDYVQGRIDTPAGMSPFVLTFDDALRGQYNILPSGKIDPNCAVGILEMMHAQHPDWPLRGTFFVLTNRDPKLPPPFYQPQFAQAKMQHLVQDGFEIGNHTVHHYMGMNTFPKAKVQAEFAGAVAGIQRYLPSYNVDTLALPYGVFPRDIHWVITGESGEIRYHNICAMLAGANPAPSPVSRRFNPYQLPRIIPGKEVFALNYWLKYLQTHPGQRFISDGDPETYTVSEKDVKDLDLARLEADHYHLRVYQGTHLLIKPTG
jgi:peptidoglycan/xylan/chitin deacetylase (PgdA/CDA1 family)